MSDKKSGRVVFIGNIPYGLTEEQIMHTFSSAGQVLNFRLVYDKDTGRPKGFGFAEFSDADAAASAVRNLNDFEIMGRKLRVDYSNDGGTGDNAPAGYSAPIQQTTNGQDTAPNPQSGILPALPPGAELPPNLTCPDAISRTLKTLPAPQLLDILSQMKGLVTSDPAKATELLRQAPQLSYAIFQALLLLDLVDTSVLASVIETNPPQAPPVQPPPLVQHPPVQAPLPYLPPQAQPQLHQPQLPQFPLMPPHHMNMNVPTPPIHSQPYQPPQPQPPSQPQLYDQATQAALIQRVLAMTQQELDALPPTERGQIIGLRQQLMGAQRF